MQQVPVLSYSEQKSLIDLLGSNTLIINDQRIIEMASKGILGILGMEESEVVGMNCSEILSNIGIDFNQYISASPAVKFENITGEMPVYLKKNRYNVKCMSIMAENNKYLFVLEEIKQNNPVNNRTISNSRGKTSVNQKTNNKVKLRYHINEYGIFLKIFKEASIGIAILKRNEGNDFVITIYNDKFNEEFKISGSNLFNEIFSDFPVSWISKNLAKPFFTSHKKYEGYYHREKEKYFNLFFSYLASGLLMLTIIDSTEQITLNRSMVNTIYDSVEKERDRIARDLHDGLGALLSSISMRMNILKSGKLEHDKQMNVIENTAELVSMAVFSGREILRNIRPYELKDSDFRISLVSYIEKIQKAAEIEIRFKDENFKDTMDEKKETQLFRIICELINNSLKHSGADLIEIALDSNGERVYLNYRDNGKGFDPARVTKTNSEGMGIANIINRTRGLNGAYKFSSEPGKGMKFKLVI